MDRELLALEEVLGSHNRGAGPTYIEFIAFEEPLGIHDNSADPMHRAFLAL